MRKYLIITFLLTRLFAINGYLYQYEISDCQDECSQYAIEPEAYEFPNINVIFQDSTINIDLYLNRFVEVDLGQEITCVECSAFEVLEINLSENCNFPADCFQDPCITYECEINPDLVCIPNFCGGCYADFYDSDGTLVECTSLIEECFDLSDIDFGDCEMLLGAGWNGYECEYFSGCDWIVDDIDYSDYFFDSLEECEENCQCEDGEVIDDDPCNPMECFDGQWYEIIIDCAEDMGFPCEGGLYIPPEEGECCSECILFGDINYDYSINILDVVEVVQLVLNGGYNEIVDINYDGTINILDIIEIIEIILD